LNACHILPSLEQPEADFVGFSGKVILLFSAALFGPGSATNRLLSSV